MEQSNIFLHEKCSALFPLEIIGVWLGSCSPQKVTQSITTWACSLHSSFTLQCILGSGSPAHATTSWVLLWHMHLLSDQPTSSCPLKLPEVVEFQIYVSKGLPPPYCRVLCGEGGGRMQHQCQDWLRSIPSSSKCHMTLLILAVHLLWLPVLPACPVPHSLWFCSMQVQRHWNTPTAFLTASPPLLPSWGACGHCT